MSAPPAGTWPCESGLPGMLAVLFMNYQYLASSSVWARELNAAELSTVSSQVSAAYYDQPAFIGTSSFVITWEDMVPYNNPNPALDPVSLGTVYPGWGDATGSCLVVIVFRPFHL